MEFYEGEPTEYARVGSAVLREFAEMNAALESLHRARVKLTELGRNPTRDELPAAFGELIAACAILKAGRDRRLPMSRADARQLIDAVRRGAIADGGTGLGAFGPVCLRLLTTVRDKETTHVWSCFLCSIAEKYTGINPVRFENG